MLAHLALPVFLLLASPGSAAPVDAAAAREGAAGLREVGAPVAAESSRPPCVCTRPAGPEEVSPRPGVRRDRPAPLAPSGLQPLRRSDRDVQQPAPAPAGTSLPDPFTTRPWPRAAHPAPRTTSLHPLS